MIVGFYFRIKPVMLMTGLKIVVSGLNVGLTSVYWVDCPTNCPQPTQLQSVTGVDTFYVVTSLPFDGTSRHAIKRVLIVAAHNGTSVCLDVPQSTAGDAWTPGERCTVHLDAFETLAVDSDDFTGLSVKSSKPVFVSPSPVMCRA